MLSSLTNLSTLQRYEIINPQNRKSQPRFDAIIVDEHFAFPNRDTQE